MARGPSWQVGGMREGDVPRASNKSVRISTVSVFFYITAQSCVLCSNYAHFGNIKSSVFCFKISQNTVWLEALCRVQSQQNFLLNFFLPSHGKIMQSKKLLSQ